MLVILYGPSGSGKTTVLQQLYSRHSWSIVRKWSTRSRRLTDINVMSISLPEFTRKRECGALHAPRFVFGYWRADMADDIQEATVDPYAFWGLDQMIEYRDLYSSIEALEIVLMTETLSQLEEQLVSSQRHDRLPFAALSFRLHSEFVKNSIGNTNVRHVINYRNSAATTADRIQEEALKYREACLDR